MIIVDDINKVGRLGANYLNSFTLGKGGNIGSYGDINFIVSRYDQVITPNSFDVKNQNKIEKFDNLGAKEYSQFRNSKLKSISMNFKLISVLANIQNFLEKINKISENGEVYPVIIGQKQIGENDFIITSWSYKIMHTDANGQIEAAEVQLNLEEYIKRIIRTEVINSIEIQEKNTHKNINTNTIENIRNKEAEYKEIEKLLAIEEEELKRGNK